MQYALCDWCVPKRHNYHDLFVILHLNVSHLSIFSSCFFFFFLQYETLFHLYYVTFLSKGLLISFKKIFFKPIICPVFLANFIFLFFRKQFPFQKTDPIFFTFWLKTITFVFVFSLILFLTFLCCLIVSASLSASYEGKGKCHNEQNK